MPSSAPAGPAKRLAVLTSRPRALTHLRGGLIRAAVGRGTRVLALAPGLTAGACEPLSAMGSEPQPLATATGSLPFLAERKHMAAISAQLAGWSAGAVLVCGIDMIPLGVRAARRAGVSSIVALLTETGGGSLDARTRSALAQASVVVAHNSTDQRVAAEALGIPLSGVKCVAGAGADLNQPLGRSMPAASDRIVFLAASRLDRVKGVHDYLEAARIARARGIAADFKLAGPDGVEADAIRPETLARYAGDVQYIGDKADVAAAICDAHVFVSPSKREGMPHAVLQALAAGRPIVATDIAGSRDTVDEMVNGTLVPPGSPQDLAAAFERIVRNRALLPAMSRASRAKAERGFSADAVNTELLAALGIA